jgi:polyhydroxyalkanoate synthesis regulator phasin
MVINGQSAMKSELLTEIGKLDEKLTNRIDSLEKNMNKGFEKVNDRVDKLGKSLAYLEDDAPTRDEFDKLDERVGNLEQNIVAV